MKYKRGDRVKHPNMPQWGLGEVLKEPSGDILHIFFMEVGEKQLSLNYVKPMKVIGKEARHPVLDNLIVKSSNQGIQYQSLSLSIEKFLKMVIKHKKPVMVGESSAIKIGIKNGEKIFSRFSEGIPIPVSLT